MSVSEAKKLKALEEENRRLRQLVANLAGQCGLEECSLKKLVKPAARRSVVGYMASQYEMSERHACSVVQRHRSSCRYGSTSDGNNELREVLRALAAARPQWGQERLHVLVRRQGFMVNHKRTERVYRELGLSLRLRKRSKRASTVSDSVARSLIPLSQRRAQPPLKTQPPP